MTLFRWLLPVVVAALLLASCTSGNGPSPEATATPPAANSTAVPTAPGMPMTAIPDAPEADPFDLARRYQGYNGTTMAEDVLYPMGLEPGHQRSFWIIDPIPPAFSQIDAELRHVGQHALWYAETSISVDDDTIAEAARRFDEDIFPHVSAIFGPNVEVPGPITIVTTPLNGLAGYFTSSDALPQAVSPHSNERVGVFMAPSIGSDQYLGTLAHEFQHVIQWLADPTEDTWMNEGLAEFAPRSMGLPSLPFDSYLGNPGVSLRDWPEEVGASLPNYAGGSLFIEYLAHRTGVENAHHLVSQPLDGIAGIDAYLDEIEAGMKFRELFADWLVANLVGASAGEYAYPEPPGAVNGGRTIRNPVSETGQVPQTGGWYARLDPGDSPLTVEFDGRSATALLPVVPYSGEHCWWSNRGDSINSTLTRSFDLTGVSEATLNFWAWHHIEDGWDHGYVSVSTDNGSTWTALEGQHTATNDPMRVTYGPSYTGRTDRWVPEEIDLSPYAGNEILLRFEYVTDEAVNTIGWCVDDIEIPEIGFVDDAESRNHDWDADGFERITSRGVEQRFIVQLVEGTGNDAQVTRVELDRRNRAVFTVSTPQTLVITALAPKTSQPGVFSYDVTR